MTVPEDSAADHTGVIVEEVDFQTLMSRVNSDLVVQRVGFLPDSFIEPL